MNGIFSASLNYSSERKQERSLVSWSTAKQKMPFDFVLKFVWKFRFTICSTEVSLGTLNFPKSLFPSLSLPFSTMVASVSLEIVWLYERGYCFGVESNSPGQKKCRSQKLEL